MKKVILGITIFLGILITGIGVFIKFFQMGGSSSNNASSIAVIGGADGPTAIFVGGKVGMDSSLWLLFLLLGLILVIAAIVIYIKTRNND